MEEINWSEIPEYISKEQLYKLCHISKNTARRLLAAGIIPCKLSRKRTWRYVIRKEDVQAFLANRSEYFDETHGWRKSLPKDKHINLSVAPIYDMTDFYAELFFDLPDVIEVKDISKATDYLLPTVTGWCRSKHLKYLMADNKYKIPKVFLIEFFNSSYARTIDRKSDWHMNATRQYLFSKEGSKNAQSQENCGL